MPGRRRKKEDAAAGFPLIRTCANCLHFRVMDEGYEIGRIEDTRYMTSRCEKLGWRVKEFYLFPPGEEGRRIKKQEECPYWEHFKMSEAGRAGK